MLFGYQMVFCRDSPSNHSLSLVPQIAESQCTLGDEGEEGNSGEGGEGTVYGSSDGSSSVGGIGL